MYPEWPITPAQKRSVATLFYFWGHPSRAGNRYDRLQLFIISFIHLISHCWANFLHSSCLSQILEKQSESGRAWFGQGVLEVSILHLGFSLLCSCLWSNSMALWSSILPYLHAKSCCSCTCMLCIGWIYLCILLEVWMNIYLVFLWT